MASELGERRRVGPRSVALSMIASDGVEAAPSGSRSPLCGTTHRLGRALYLAWSASCVSALVVLIGTRWLRYTRWSAVPALDHVLREMMVVTVQLFLWPWAYTTVNFSAMLLAVAVLAAGLHRRLLRHVVTSCRGRWRLTPATVSLVLGVMVWFHYLFDVNPTVAATCATSLVLASLLEHPRVASLLPRPVCLVAWGVFFVVWLVAAGDFADRLTMIAWAVILLASHRWLVSRTGRLEIGLLRVLLVMPMNLLPAYVPLVLPLHAGHRLGDGLAYSFCELPDRGDPLRQRSALRHSDHVRELP